MMLYITRGLPGSGKTTWAQALVDSLENTVRVNRDDIRIHQMGITSGIGTGDQEQLVTEIQLTTVRKYLRWGWNVIVDDTNLRQAVAREWADVAVECGADFSVVDFTDVPLELCKERCRLRAETLTNGRYVAPYVLDNMYERFLKKGPLAEVVPTVKTTILTDKYVPDTNLPVAWIFDIDGTLANMHPQRSPYDWSKVHLDTLHEPVAEIANMIKMTQDKVIVVSGRDGACRELTEKWLSEYFIEYDELLMRPAGDNRKDSLVKAEIFWRDIAPKYNVFGVFDDRNSVVEMWRDLGLTCFQVAPGDF